MVYFCVYVFLSKYVREKLFGRIFFKLFFNKKKNIREYFWGNFLGETFFDQMICRKIQKNLRKQKKNIMKQNINKKNSWKKINLKTQKKIPEKNVQNLNQQKNFKSNCFHKLIFSKTSYFTNNLRLTYKRIIFTCLISTRYLKKKTNHQKWAEKILTGISFNKLLHCMYIIC